jgi:hypothetical protein
MEATMAASFAQVELATRIALVTALGKEAGLASVPVESSQHHTQVPYHFPFKVAIQQVPSPAPQSLRSYTVRLSKRPCPFIGPIAHSCGVATRHVTAPRMRRYSKTGAFPQIRGAIIIQVIMSLRFEDGCAWFISSSSLKP